MAMFTPSFLFHITAAYVPSDRPPWIAQRPGIVPILMGDRATGGIEAGVPLLRKQAPRSQARQPLW